MTLHFIKDFKLRNSSKQQMDLILKSSPFCTAEVATFKNPSNIGIIIIIIIIIIRNLFTAIALLPGGGGYFTCIQNMKLVTTKFKSGGLHEEHVVATWNLGNHLNICL